jgi:hypothetical protein
MITFTIEADTPEDFVRQASVLFPLARIAMQPQQGPSTERPAVDPTATATEVAEPAELATEEADTTGKPKRKRRTKAEIAAAEAAAQPDVETLPVSIDDIRAVANAIQAKLGADALDRVGPIYQSVGATKTSEVPADKYEEVHAKLVALLAEIEAAAPAGEVTVQEVRAAGMAVLAKHGSDDGHAKCIAVAKKLGHDKLTQLEPSQYAEAVALLKAEVED